MIRKNLNKLWNILDSKQRKDARLIVLLLVLSMLIETLSIGLVFPVISVLFKVGNTSSNFFEEISNSFFTDINYEQIVIFSLFVLLSVFLLKSLFLTLIAKIEVKKIVNIKLIVAEKLYKKFLLSPYSFHLKNNSSSLINFTNDQVDAFGNSLFSYISLLAEILVAIGIISILLFFEPRSTLLILSLALIFGLVFFLLVNKKISLLSKKRLENKTLKIKDLQEGFGAIKEIKIYNKESFFIRIFKIHNNSVFEIEAFEDFIKRLPRLWFEFLSVLIFISFLLFIVIFYDYDFISITPTLGLFGVASVRLIPSINRVIMAIQTINFSEAGINVVSKNITSIKNTNNESIQKIKNDFKDKIVFKNVSFSYDSNKKILDDMNLEIKKGDFIGIFGETGSGKSTFLNILLGLIFPNKGKILMDSKEILTDLSNWQAQIGFVPQSIHLLDDSIKNNIAFGLSEDEIDILSLRQAIKDAELDNFVNSLSENFNTKVGERGARISGGQLQRIGIARALYKNSQVLIFDEATGSLDSETESNLMNTINKLKKDKTIIFVSHKKKPMEFCNKLFEIKQGKIIEKKQYE